MPESPDEGSFLNTIFDTTFETFVTEKLIRVIYIVLLVGIFLGVGVMVLSSFLNNGIWIGLLSLIFAPILYVILIVIVRVALEFVVVVFRIAANTQKIADNIDSPGD